MPSTASRMPAPVKRSLARCLPALEHGLALARIAATGTEPERAVEHLVGMLDDLAPELRQLRAWSKAIPGRRRAVR